MIGSETAFTFAAVDQFVGEQIKVSRDFPNLRVHDNRGFDADHIEAAGSSGGLRDFVVLGDHV